MPSAARVLEAAIYSLINLMPYLVLALYPFTDKLRFGPWMTAALASVLAAIQMGIGVGVSLFWPELAGVFSFFSTGLYAVFYIAVVRERMGKLLFMLLMVSNFANMVVMLAKCLEGAVWPELALERNRWTFSLCSVFVQFLTLPPLFWFFRRYLKQAVMLQAETKVWRYLWLIPLTFYLLWYYLLYFSESSALQRALRPQNSVFTVCINLGALLTYRVTTYSLQQADENMKLQAENYRLSIASVQLKNLQTRMEQTRRARHDLRQHMSVLLSYAQEGQYARLQQYLQEYLCQLDAQPRLRYCANAALDAIVGYYAQYAADRQIAFEAQITVPGQLAVQDADLTVLFGNLLENACRGCMTQPAPQRRIRLQITAPQAELLTFTLENTYSGSISMHDGRFLSTSHAGFGTGTESAASIAGRYGGELRFCPEDGIFRVTGILNPQENSSLHF